MHLSTARMRRLRQKNNEMPDVNDQNICIEVAYAESAQQYLRTAWVPTGTTARMALQLAPDLQTAFPRLDLRTCPIGIFGTQVADTKILQSGDRVEIYRELKMDPREARRLRANS